MVTSAKMQEWTQEEVFRWLQTECKMPKEEAQILLTADMNGEALQSLGGRELPVGISLGPTMIVLKHIQNLQIRSSLIVAMSTQNYD